MPVLRTTSFGAVAFPTSSRRSTIGEADVTAVAAPPFHSNEKALFASPFGSVTAFERARRA